MAPRDEFYFCHSLVFGFLLHRHERFTGKYVEITSSLNLHARLRKINHSGPGRNLYEFYEWY